MLGQIYTWNLKSGQNNEFLQKNNRPAIPCPIAPAVRACHSTTFIPIILRRMALNILGDLNTTTFISTPPERQFFSSKIPIKIITAENRKTRKTGGKIMPRNNPAPRAIKAIPIIFDKRLQNIQTPPLS